MITWGWTGMAHDASLAVFNDNGLEFAAHSERYSRIKNDKNLHYELIHDALKYGHPDKIYFYEKPWLKKTRQFYAGQYTLLRKESPTTYMRKYVPNAPRCTTTSHHLSHAAAGYYTNPFDHAGAAVLVLDSIGEWETVSIWEGKGTKLRKRWSQRYPHSVGIWYSAMTQRMGLEPQRDEYLVADWAKKGNPKRLASVIRKEIIDVDHEKGQPQFIKMRHNLHRGCRWWRPELKTQQDMYDIAAATQTIFEYCVNVLSIWAKVQTGSKHVALAGGGALNKDAIDKIKGHWETVHVPKNPGDPGSCIGAVLTKNKTKVSLDKVWYKKV